ncbi:MULTISPECIES: RsiV family protein [unclassified Pseudomonas]|uniref:RsiV family protein n=1 Tax=unclassified Pseudomonas TaxID=196821 RepID=UPI000BD968CB|nr:MULTISPECIES: RsiV family protein [unclassified Pseudomonas]PVZ15630.1 hypothetical protein F474_02409 [Pseudomonas sp. URIL14HWK12:I12]PVZ25004.1 hypothetical protein F470_02064 [Pseudomonas sp. URIL14HWK12:I10]PVZ34850.1 hypothetical protein F472_02410 [Pseudomonas sp. URIL14HWK12:I11]SNZ09456.1 hypothetical protein SAMN05660463_01397 [Pseudomonas sp. URIL14HWK12:I9]
MSLPRLTALALLVASLSACQSLFQPAQDKPLPSQREAWEHTKPGCTGNECPLVNIDTLHFADEPALDALVQQRLLALTGLKPPPASLQAYEQQFLASAAPRNASYLQAKVREQHDGLVIVELSSYLDKGGAHGEPGRGFINYSRAQHKALTLQDMLVPGQESTFWLAAQEAHRGWLIDAKLAQDPGFVKQWPFQTTDNIALGQRAVLLKYDVSSIAPYALGHIELAIPYARLNGVIKPELVPARR